ncbi:MAG TPA: hypothetical protein VFR02_07870, partial [bacterium]|nr:hypothetical protein [bacterium]
KTREPWLLVFPGVIFLSILPVQDLGVRYLLPAYPFLILLGGRAAARLWDWQPRTSRRAGKLLAVGLLAWQAATALLNNGNLVSYFNDLVPPGKKLYLLGDSNLDWGQETGKMARFARKEGWTRVKLAQFGGLDPGFYGLKAEGWTKRDLQGPQPGWVYLANAALLQEGPVFEPDLKPMVESWMLTVPPTGRVGDTWYYWDVPGTPAADPTAPVDSRRPMGARERGLIPASRSAGP